MFFYILTAVTEAEYKSRFEPTEYIPYLPQRASYGMYFCENFGEIDCVITAPHSISPFTQCYIISSFWTTGIFISSMDFVQKQIYIYMEVLVSSRMCI